MKRVGSSNHRLKNIKSILFDLDGTLRQDKPEVFDVILVYLQEQGFEIDVPTNHSARRWEHYYWGMSPELAEDKQKYPEDDLFWVNFARRYLMAFNFQQENAHQLAPGMVRNISECYQPQDWVPPDTRPTLHTLRESGFQLGLLSNRRTPCHKQLEELGLAEYFDLILVAGDVNYWKPDPRLFQEALDRLGSSPAHSIHIGDNYYTDVLGAQEAGLGAVLYDPRGIFPNPGCPVIQSLEGVLGLPEI